MKVLFVTSEAQPFAASGGLADVSGSLPQALRRRLIGTRIVMPLYDEIPQNLKDEMRFITSLSVPVAWRRQYCGVFEARWGGVIYYFLDNQYYFKRSGLYGHYDDAERFAFFSRAVLEMLPLSTLSLILFIVMTGRQLSYLHTIHFFMGKINGIRVLRLSLLFIISSIKVSMAQSFMKRLLVFHHISVQSSIGTAALTL